MREGRSEALTPRAITAYLDRYICLLYTSGSLILDQARRSRVPAGKALAVDRQAFSEGVTGALTSEPLVTVVREELREVPQGPAIIASGPLTSEPLAGSLSRLVGEKLLSFFDAVAPVVTAESIDMTRAYRGGRRGLGDDYINCPMTREEYEAFQAALALSLIHI